MGLVLGIGTCCQLRASLHVDPGFLLLLQGHKSQILCLAFAPDATKMVTASKDGTWRVWNINVRYHQQEDPKTLLQHQQEVMVALQCMHMQEKKRKDYAFWHQLNEKPSIMPGGLRKYCCGLWLLL